MTLYPEFKNKVVFMTGIGGAMGAKIAEHFVEAEAIVIGTDINFERISPFASELTEKGLKAAERWSNECAALEEKMLQGFSPEEAETLRTLLARLLENMVRIEK